MSCLAGTWTSENPCTRVSFIFLPAIAHPDELTTPLTDKGDQLSFSAAAAAAAAGYIL